MSDAVRWGFLSTADINDKLLAGAAESDEVEVLAVASRDAGRAEAYAREHGIERAYGSYEDTARRPGRRGGLHLAAELDARRLVDPRARGGQARALREAAQPPAERGRARLRRRRPRRPDPHGGVHVAAQPADGEAEGARRRRRDRRAAPRPRGVQLPARRPDERPPERRARRRRAHGRRLLLRLRLAAPRGRARAGLRRAGRVADAASTSSSPATLRFPGDVLAEIDCGLVLTEPRRARGDRRRGLALPRRPLALPQAGDRAPNGATASSGSSSSRRTPTASSSRTSATRSAARRSRCSAARTRSARRARSRRCTARPRRAGRPSSSPVLEPNPRVAVLFRLKGGQEE